jgi:hypothetical protein
VSYKSFLVFALGAAVLAAFGFGRLIGAQVPAAALTAAYAADGGPNVEVPTVLPRAAAKPAIPTGFTEPQPAGAEHLWRPAEPYEDKYVPIISLLEGTRLGVARINGPRSRVALTQAVAQFSIRFMDFLNIDIYVPISTREPGKRLARVPDVGVTGLGDIEP